MKKGTVIALIIAGVLLLLGTIGIVLIGSSNQWNPEKLGTKNMTTNSFEIEGTFKNITILSMTEDVTFKKAEDGICRVEFYEWDKILHSATVENETLTIESEDSRDFLDYLSFGVVSPGITLYLPETVYENLTVTGGTGKTTVPKEFSFENISIALQTGHVDCRASVSGGIGIETDTGDIRIKDLSADELKIKTDTGKIIVSGVNCTGNIDVNVSTGDLVMENVACGSITTDGSTGDIEAKNVIAGESVRMNRGTGHINLDGCDAAELEIQTSTGKVTGTLLSEKVFIARSSTGDIEVPETVNGGKCKITTSTGDIQIQIA